jgi:hypothetical protein
MIKNIFQFFILHSNLNIYYFYFKKKSIVMDVKNNYKTLFQLKVEYIIDDLDYSIDSRYIKTMNTNNDL